LLIYGIIQLLKLPLPAEWNSSSVTIPILFVAFFIAAGEELSYMGYAVDPMQERWNANNRRYHESGLGNMALPVHNAAGTQPNMDIMGDTWYASYANPYYLGL